MTGLEWVIVGVFFLIAIFVYLVKRRNKRIQDRLEALQKAATGTTPAAQAATAAATIAGTTIAAAAQASVQSLPWWRHIMAAKVLSRLVIGLGIIAILLLASGVRFSGLPPTRGSRQSQPGTVYEEGEVGQTLWQWLVNHEGMIEFSIFTLILIALAIKGGSILRFVSRVLLALMFLLLLINGPKNSFASLQSWMGWIRGTDSASSAAGSASAPFAEVRFTNDATQVVPLSLHPSQRAAALWPGSLGRRYVSFCLVDAVAVETFRGQRYGIPLFIQQTDGRIEWTPSDAVRSHFTNRGIPIELRVHFRADPQIQC